MNPPESPVKPAYSLWEMTRYMLKLGSLGFGGPVALVGYMHRDLVEQRKWITEEDYKEGLTLAQIMPGPLAAQLAIYLGYCHYGVIGASLVGVAFVIPSFIMVVALGAAYVAYGGMSWMQSVFYGVGACVIGIIALSAQKLTHKTVGKDKLLWVIYAVLAISTIITEREIISLIIIAGIITLIARKLAQRATTNPSLLPYGGSALMIATGALACYFSVDSMTAGTETAASAAAVSDSHLLGQIAIFFGKAGAFVFGSGLAIVPFLFGGVVKEYQWLNDQQFLDAVAVAMITPGPVVITTGFIGYIVAGFAGACVAAFATFFPCYLFTVIPAPYMRRHGKVPWVLAVVDGVTAAAAGAIAGAVVVLGRRSVIDLPTILIAVTAYIILWRSKKVPEPILILLAAILGWIIHPLVRG